MNRGFVRVLATVVAMIYLSLRQTDCEEVNYL